MLEMPKAMAFIIKIKCGVDCDLSENNDEIKQLIELTRQIDLISK